jgi:hypothetical protein
MMPGIMWRPLPSGALAVRAPVLAPTVGRLGHNDLARARKTRTVSDRLDALVECLQGIEVCKQERIYVKRDLSWEPP